MNKPTIFFDLDGTILDVSERIFKVYKDILKNKNKNHLSFKRYLMLKKNKVPLLEILKATRAEDILPYYKKEWDKLIEKPSYLELDQVSNQRKQALLSLKKDYQLILITLRNNSKELYSQLRKEEIDKIFDKILVSSRKSLDSEWRIKAEILRRYKKIDKDSIIIGDTEIEILTGKHLGIKTVAVVNKMRTKKILKELKPDILIKDISELKNGILDLKISK